MDTYDFSNTRYESRPRGAFGIDAEAKKTEKELAFVMRSYTFSENATQRNVKVSKSLFANFFDAFRMPVLRGIFVGQHHK